MSLDPYKTLGVEKTADTETIKKAFRELALKYHPDKNPGDKAAEEKFKEVSEAYDILSDPEKKAAFDNMGSEQFYTRGTDGRGYQAPDFSHGFPDLGDLDDFLNSIFGGSFGKNKKGTSKRGPSPRKGRDYEYPLNLNLLDAARGAKIHLAIDLPTPCQRCGGTGTIMYKNGLRGCPECGGSGTVKKKNEITVTIPAGATDGQKLRIKGKGEPGEFGGKRGDIFLVVKIAPDKVFKRDGLNLFIEKKLDLYTLLLGGKIEVPTLNGRTSVSVPKGSQNGAKLRLKGLGIHPSKEEPGDMIVTLRAVLPVKLSDEAKDAIERLRSLAPVEESSLDA
ncbi:MAG: J domain-containing protein [Deltaproteobacteria bacterium]|jgi:molecular chaperone DnaJ|nr:J domain-containing protein [Deltaproteobacteria bacterium]